MNTAQKILDQIKALDSTLLVSIGAKGFLSAKADGTNKGYLQFKVSNCYNVSNGTNIRITLEYNDTYTVKAFTVRKVGLEDNIIAEIKDICSDNLVITINEIVG